MRVPALMPACLLSAALGLAALPTVTTAATHVLDFSGSASAFSADGFAIGGTRYDFYTLDLGSLDPGITLSAGDEVTAYITLDGPFSLPSTPAVYYTSLLFLLNDAHGNFPSGDTAASGTVTLYNNGNPTVHSGATSTTNQISFGIGLIPPDNQGLTITQATFEFTVTSMAQSATADHAQIYFTNFSPAVPEPATIALWLGGLALLGAARRRRQG